MDIVYFVKDCTNNDEFRYSLRSVCKNMKYDRVWVFGGCPKDIVPDVRIRVEQKGETKWDKVKMMFKMAAENEDLSDDFILFNDDFFIMKPMEEVPTIYRSTLMKHVSMLQRGQYQDLLKDVMRQLGKEALSYEVHTPFVFNKKKLLKIIEKSKYLHCTRTLYGNAYKIGGEQRSDVKVFDSRPPFDYKSMDMLSTDDGVVNINNDVWRYIKKNFPNRCKYEL